MRLTAIALAEGCTKLTLSCAPTLKLFQFREAFWLDWVMVVVAPFWEMLAAPDGDLAIQRAGLGCCRAEQQHGGDRFARRSIRLAARLAFRLNPSTIRRAKTCGGLSMLVTNPSALVQAAPRTFFVHFSHSAKTLFASRLLEGPRS